MKYLTKGLPDFHDDSFYDLRLHTTVQLNELAPDHSFSHYMLYMGTIGQYISAPEHVKQLRRDLNGQQHQLLTTCIFRSKFNNVLYVNHF